MSEVGIRIGSRKREHGIRIELDIFPPPPRYIGTSLTSSQNSGDVRPYASLRHHNGHPSRNMRLIDLHSLASAH
jgi:hypothetical protein